MDLRVRKVCKEKGMNLKGLADKLGISAESLSRIINGNPTVGTLQKIADTLGVSFIELFEANCPKCGMRFAAAADPPPATQPPPPRETKEGSILDFVETCADKMSDKIGLIGLKKHLKAYGGDVPINKINEKYRVGFIEYLKTGKRQNGWKPITEMYQKRMIGCFDEVLALLPDNKILDAMNTY